MDLYAPLVGGVDSRRPTGARKVPSAIDDERGASITAECLDSIERLDLV
jgi:hypothetical protein